MNKEYTSENRYPQEITVPCYQTDASFHLKPASFMDLAQELAYWAAQLLGFGYDELQVHHTAWVLSRMHFKFQNPPKWRDETVLYTWHKGLSGLFFLRDFDLRAKGDTDFADKSKSLVLCTTSWIVMNTESRRLVRSNEVLDLVPASTQCNDHAIEEPCDKIVMPKDAVEEHAGTHTVDYSDVDIIGHTNNARYIVLAMDCIGYEVTSNAMVKDVWINFNKETKPGDTIELYKFCQETEEGTSYFIEGKVDGRSCFCTKIDF